jgi:GNAT superfamily N-acetyltransferase
MRHKIIIRNLAPNDMDRILEFRKETARISFPGLKFSKEDARRTFILHDKKYPGTIKIACSGPLQIGFIMFKPKKGFLGPFGYIDIIFVKEAYRDKGVGALLLKEAESWFRRKGINRINATITDTNSHSRDFFRENGYKDTRIVVEKNIGKKALIREPSKRIKSR